MPPFLLKSIFATLSQTNDPTQSEQTVVSYSDWVGSFSLVPVVGLEPTRGISPADFESATSTNSITPAGARESYHVLSKNARVNRPLFPKNFLVRPPNPSRIR